MTEDADWVSDDGSVYEGRDAIEAAHRDWFAGLARELAHASWLAEVHFIRADVAIVDGDSYQSGLHDEQGKEIPAGVTRFTAVMVKEGGRWKWLRSGRYRRSSRRSMLPTFASSRSTAPWIEPRKTNYISLVRRTAAS